MTTGGAEFDPDDNDIRALFEWLKGDTREGSARDLQARRTLARVLRSSKPLDFGLRLILAEAVDPDGEDNVRLFLKRKPGRPQAFNERHIAVFIYQRTEADLKLESAVKEAMTKFNASHGTVTKAWSKWKPHIKRDPELYGRI
jgi:hypothetical protein